MNEIVRRLRDDGRGQTLPFVVIMIVPVMLLAACVLAAGNAEGVRSFAQRAADAAALAGAGRQISSVQSDARGVVYCDTLAVDPVAGPQAAATYWFRDTSSLPSLQTDRFLAVPQGTTLTVYATVSMPGFALALVGLGRLTWRLKAEARVVRPPGVRACGAG